MLDGLNECILNHCAKSVKFWKNKYFPYLWALLQRSMSAFSQNSFLGLILRILWSGVTNNFGVPKIHVFLHAEMLKFCLVGELSCWSLDLEYMCQISFPSVTEKVQNSREKYTYFGQF